MTNRNPIDFKSAIQASGFDIYSSIEVGDANFWIPTLQLETLLNQNLIGLDLSGLALRTSKFRYHWNNNYKIPSRSCGWY